VDNAITCWTATDVSHVTVAGNTGYGLVYDCRADHVVVVDNRVGAYSLLSLAYSDVFGNNTDIQRMPNPVGINGNVSIDPGFQSFDPGLPPAYMDVHLRPDSPLRDAGDPARFDVDGTVADLGAYGGPGGENDLFDGELDGLPDSWELRVGLDPAIDDALEDPDGDGLDNLGEFLKGTRPDVPDTDADEILDLFDDFPLDADDA
jgi:hypothetical protein